ncbi:MAG: tripartite tricarboxylate transporter substrate binding protein [Rhizobiales bacterium]|nr:tripartite tricarboxylate transporter substrate binding protein [Hyphomicrobiales bacterium]
MSSWRRWTSGIWLAGALVLSGGQHAVAQSYPARTVTVVAPYAAGGGADLIARLMAQKLADRLGQSFVVENRLGAGGVIAATSVAKASPDGYTLFMGTSTQLAIQSTLHKRLAYNPGEDFAPVAMIASVPFVLIVHPSMQVKTAGELIKLAKEKPGTLSFGSSGVGGPPHLYTELLMSMTGATMTHIPYKGTAQAMNDVVAGHVPIIFSDLAPAVALVKENKVRALGVSSSVRVAALPDVPPIAETGVPGFDAVAWLMMVAPAKTPKDVVAKLHKELRSIVAEPDTQKRLVAMGVIPLESESPDELQRYVKSEMVRWGKVVQQAGLAGSQ